MKNTHKMTITSGFLGSSSNITYLYRGHIITRTYRSHDVRNKTHNGYWWGVQFLDGKSMSGLPTRREAKDAIDRYQEAAKAAEIRADHARITEDVDMAGPEVVS